MKKFFLILPFVALFSCSESDNNSSVAPDEHSINPPSWIQGTWLNQEFLDAGISSGFKFASDNFCTVLYTNTTCYKEQPLQFNEISTTTSYEIVLTGSGTGVTYHFTKISNTQIEANGLIYTKQ